MSETNLMKRILVRLSSLPGVRMFRNNVGLAYAGRPTKQGSTIILKDGYPIKFGLFKGSSDLIGWTEVNGHAVFTSIEIKTDKGRPTAEQLKWIDAVTKAGGIAGIARSEEQAQEIINDYRIAKKAGIEQGQAGNPDRGVDTT